MSFTDDVSRFSLKVERVTNDVFVNVVSATKSSITDGSTVTGAPGQPVRDGTLKASWQVEFESPTSALISSGGAAAAYNRNIEYAIGKYGPLTLRSAVGGFHSVALTIAGFGRLVADEAQKVAK